jgi:putative isomerase
MFREAGAHIPYPFLTAGSKVYEDTLWDWDSWLNHVALHDYYLPESGEPVFNRGFQNWNFLVLNMINWLEGKDAMAEF